MDPPRPRLVRLHVGDGGSLLARGLGRVVIFGSIGLLGLFAVATPASADGGEETTVGYLLVQQALGYLADDTGSASIDLAMEKVEDALATDDQDGVAVADVEQAEQALEAGQAGKARKLLQGSITQALADMAPAMGEETGTTVVAPALPGREDLTGRDWGFLVASLVLLLAGIGLAFRFRPGDTVAELRRRLGPAGAGDPTPGERER